MISPNENKTAKSEDGKPYTTLSYANGVGYHPDDSGSHNLEEENAIVQSDRFANLEEVDTKKIIVKKHMPH